MSRVDFVRLSGVGTGAPRHGPDIGVRLLLRRGTHRWAQGLFNVDLAPSFGHLVAAGAWAASAMVDAGLRWAKA